MYFVGSGTFARPLARSLEGGVAEDATKSGRPAGPEQDERACTRARSPRGNPSSPPSCCIAPPSSANHTVSLIQSKAKLPEMSVACSTTEKVCLYSLDSCWHHLPRDTVDGERQGGRGPRGWRRGGGRGRGGSMERNCNRSRADPRCCSVS